MATKKTAKKNNSKKALKIYSIIITIGLLCALIIGFMFYRWIYAPNISELYTHSYFYVYTNETFYELMQRIEKEKLLKNNASFKWVAEKKQYPSLLKPGKYKIDKTFNNNKLVNLLRIGDQEPIMVTFNSIRLKEQLAQKLAEYFEPDSAEFAAVFNNHQILKQYDVTPESLLSLFIPNTYEMYWNTSPEQFLTRMKREYDTFWTNDRIEKAQKLNLSKLHVSVLASIVQQETSRKDEMPTVAGVYLNRLKMGMPLQADPTLIYALGDFSIKRVLNIHKEVNSPYNTYKFKGLPPGPICLPEIYTLEAVLNSKQHNYLYFCAKEDFSGYHNFATNYSIHLINARKYQQALNQRNILK